MPYHRVPATTVHEDIIAIEREGERIVCVHKDDGVFHIFTNYLGQPVERRTFVFGGDAA